ncbi:MAG TPA: Hpt domain-containing protein, partial [Candidatus Dormibacteraeota bacterium]|nr:Hpt domain-containing protein [Candidatus Dormibacteraeota bacterium]
AVDRNEAAALNRLAHSLKSSSAMVGALRLSEMCGHLEAQARNASLDSAAERVAEIEAEFARVVRALEAVGQGVGS